MKRKTAVRVIVGLALFTSSPLCMAAQFLKYESIRMFSRANCVSINESITWSPQLTIFSGEVHSIQRNAASQALQWYIQGPENGWRIRAGCFGCTAGGWTVEGRHYISQAIDPKISNYCVGKNPCFTSYTEDCTLSEGWV